MVNYKTLQRYEINGVMPNKNRLLDEIRQPVFYYSIFLLFSRDVFVDILAADEGIEEDIEETDNGDDVGEQVAYVVGKHILEERQDTATADECHKDTAGSRSVFAESFGSKVEDSPPHHAGHQTAEEHDNHADRQLDAFEGNDPSLREEHHAEKHDDSRSRNGSEHCLAADLAANSTTEETTAHHHQPIEADYGTCNSGTYERVVGHIEVGGVRNTHLDTYIEEYGDGTKHEMTERHRAVFVLVEAGGRTLLGSFDMRFGDVGEEYNQESHHEDNHCGEHGRSRIGNGGGACLTTDEVTQENRCDSTADRVARTTELNQLVTALATTTEGVEHRVDHDIEEAHGETGNEGTEDINTETLGITAQPLNTDTDETDGYCQQRGEFVTFALKDDTTRDTHTSIGNEIGECTELRHGIRCTELVFHDDAHRTCKVGNEGNHKKEEKHHYNRQYVSGLIVTHSILFFVCLMTGGIEELENLEELGYLEEPGYLEVVLQEQHQAAVEMGVVVAFLEEMVVVGIDLHLELLACLNERLYI